MKDKTLSYIYKRLHKNPNNCYELARKFMRSAELLLQEKNTLDTTLITYSKRESSYEQNIINVDSTFNTSNTPINFENIVKFMKEYIKEHEVVSYVLVCEILDSGPNKITSHISEDVNLLLIKSEDVSNAIVLLRRIFKDNNEKVVRLGETEVQINPGNRFLSQKDLPESIH